MTDAQKIAMIRDICNHPGSFHWTGLDVANAIKRVIDDEKPIDFTLSQIDMPIPYELVHDAVAEEIEE